MDNISLEPLNIKMYLPLLENLGQHQKFPFHIVPEIFIRNIHEVLTNWHKIYIFRHILFSLSIPKTY